MRAIQTRRGAGLEEGSRLRRPTQSRPPDPGWASRLVTAVVAGYCASGTALRYPSGDMATRPVSSHRESSLIARRVAGVLMAGVIAWALLRSVRSAGARSASTGLAAQSSARARVRRWPTLALAVVAAIGAAVWTLGDVIGTVGAISAAATVWFVVPLAWARWTGDSSLIDDLLAERRRSLTVLLLSGAGHLIAAAAAICAEVLRYLWGWQPTCWLSHSRGGWSRACRAPGQPGVGGGLALVVVAWAAYPLAAGFSAARGHRGGVAEAVARMVRWGGRAVTGTMTRLRSVAGK